jgi:HAD superfamily hydrolase (TIGR01509 family)
MTEARASPVWQGPPGPFLGHLEAISFDFGNTLVPVPRAGLRRVVETMADDVIDRCGPFDRDVLLAVWGEERDRQFAEEVPELREADLDRRMGRVLARMRGYPGPAPGTRWDDSIAATYSTAEEIRAGVDVYSRAFVELIPAPPEVGPMLARLAARYRLAVLSNWPLAVTIDRFVEAAGWSDSLSAVVVSQRVGTIKPSPEIFRVTAAALGCEPQAILHVGDDWVADVVGGRRAGWHVAYLRARADSSLPASARDDSVAADFEIDRLGEIEAALAARDRR